MNFALVSIIVPRDTPASAEYQMLEGHVRTGALQLSQLEAPDCIDQIKKLIDDGQEPAVIVLASGVPRAIPLARSIRAICADGHILFVSEPGALGKIGHELSYTPMLGPNWSLIERDDQAFAQKVQRAASSVRQRRRLRTTLDRVNLRLNAPKPVDSLEYRRKVISEHYLANLLQQSSDAIITLDTQDHLLYWSPAAERMFGAHGFSAGTKVVRGLPFWSASLDEPLQEIRSGRMSAIASVDWSTDGHVLSLEILFSRVHEENNAFIGTLLTIRDTSERNKVLELERAARREAERLSRMKDEFLAILSHELRTPLSAVIGRAQLLKMKYRNSPELLSSLTVIERNVELQAKLIEDLLDVSSIITGKLHLEMQPVSVASWVDTAIESARPAAEKKNIRLLRPPQAESGFVQGDPYRLQQVLYNLLSNAIKFTPEGGQVQVHVRQDGPRIEVAVQDNGLGIGPDFLPLVFERFGQEDASITRRQGGLGLGLSIAKQLVELHGGTIRADSPGRNLGATFTLTLPALAHAPGSECSRNFGSNEGTDDSKSLDHCRILLVEDVRDSRELIVEMLQARGAVVSAVDSAEAALRSLQAEVPDVLVSDIAMPGMDGYELITKVRSMGLTRDALPAIALTAFAASNDRNRALTSGYQAHVAKPINASQLVATICDLVHARRP